jgi:hypothetical protein
VQAILRKSLYMPAMAAIKYNDVIKKFATPLATNGKSECHHFEFQF